MKERAAPPPDAGESIIDKLIEEALLEFTSLKGEDADQTEEDGDRVSVPSAMPLNPDQFVDPTNWANEISIGDLGRSKRDPLRASIPTEALSEGNLSALEDPEPVSPTNHGSRGAAELGAPVLPGPMEAAAARVNAKAIAEGPPRKRGAVVGAVVFVATAAAFAAAWFAHLIPH